MERGKKVIGLFLIALMLVPFSWFLPVMVSTVQNFISPSSYTRVTVANGTRTQEFGSNSRKIGSNYYSFSYNSSSVNQGVFGVYELGSGPAWNGTSWVSSWVPTFPAIVGATYKAYGLEIKVSEVHPGYIVLWSSLCRRL